MESIRLVIHSEEPQEWVFRGNSRIKTLHSQRDLKGELTHICHFKVEETVGDPDSSEVTKLMISNAKTRMQTFHFLN